MKTLMRTKIKILMLGFAATLASCSNDDTLQSENTDGLVPVSITASVSDKMTTRIGSSMEDEPVNRCLMQIFTTDGEKLTAATGDLNGVKTMTKEGNTYVLRGLYLNPTVDYVFLFWADATGYTATDLTNVTLAADATTGIAYYAREDWDKETTISATLTHAVTKVTVKTTTDVEAGSLISVTVPTTYTAFDVSNGRVTGNNSSKTFTSAETPSITGDKTDGAHVFSFYALVGDDTTQELMLKNLSNTGTQCDVPSVPLGKNKHITLLGDVRNLGLTSVTFTASIDENWGDGGTVGFPKYDLSAENVTINGSSEVYVYGNGQPTSHTITITGDAEVHLIGVNINSTDGPGINITSGSPTLVIEGENSVTSSNNTAVAVGDGATVTITGENGITDKLTAIGGGTNGVIDDAGTAGAGIGSLINATTGGNIIIENVTVEATGATTNHIAGTPCNGGAGIGSAGPGSCGNIEITNAVITATGGIYAAAIGLGYSVENSENSQFGKIDITNSIITATGGQAAAVIGFSYLGSRTSATGEGINITTNETAETFLAGLTLNTENVTGTQYKIGKGAHMSNVTITFNGGVTFTASNGTQTHADGIGQ